MISQYNDTLKKLAYLNRTFFSRFPRFLSLFHCDLLSIVFCILFKPCLEFVFRTPEMQSTHQDTVLSLRCISTVTGAIEIAIAARTIPSMCFVIVDRSTVTLPIADTQVVGSLGNFACCKRLGPKLFRHDSPKSTKVNVRIYMKYQGYLTINCLASAKSGAGEPGISPSIAMFPKPHNAYANPALAASSQ